MAIIAPNKWLNAFMNRAAADPDMVDPDAMRKEYEVDWIDLDLEQPKKGVYRPRKIHNIKQFEEAIKRLGYEVRRVLKIRGETPAHNEVLVRRGMVELPHRSGVGVHKIYRKSSIKFCDVNDTKTIIRSKMYAHGNGYITCYGTYDELYERLTEHGEYGRIALCSQLQLVKKMPLA